MKPRRKRIEPRLRSLLAVSLAIHLVLFYLLAVFHFSFPLRREEPLCYVDLSSLPVASPRPGAAAPAAVAPSPVPTPADAPSPPPPAMKTPAPAAAKPAPRAAAVPAAAGRKQSSAADDYEQRMAQMASDRDARDLEAAMQRLRERQVPTGSKAPAGTPAGSGTQTGSSYPAYIQSRLADAFRQTIAYQGGNPETAVRLTIDTNGRIIGQKIERSSRDQLFENAVRRAIALAETTFTPPPDGRRFEIGFVFRPQGVMKK